MSGFRQQQQPKGKEKMRNLEARLANLEMASRISQMMTQQLMQNMKNMQEDLGRSLGILNEMQYKILAMQELSGLDVTKMNEIANVQRLKDFNEASDREDAESQFTVGTVVDEKSVVVITSKTEETDRGIFRSRIQLAKCGVPDLINAFMGREVGAKALITLNGVEHEVELLAIRQPPAELPAVAGQQDADAGPGKEQGRSDDTSLQTGSAQVAGTA